MNLTNIFGVVNDRRGSFAAILKAAVLDILDGNIPVVYVDSECLGELSSRSFADLTADNGERSAWGHLKGQIFPDAKRIELIGVSNIEELRTDKDAKPVEVWRAGKTQIERDQLKAERRANGQAPNTEVFRAKAADEYTKRLFAAKQQV